MIGDCRKAWKVWGACLVVFALLYLGADYVLRSRLILPEFSALERQEDARGIESIVDAILREAYHLRQLASDWASWDDMYAYVRDGNEAFEQSNFQWESLNASGIDLIYVCTTDGRRVWGGIHDPDLDRDVSLAEFPEDLCPGDLLAAGKGADSSKTSGILLTERGPMLVAALPILTSTGAGPVRGTLVMGHFLRDRTIRDLARQTRIAFTVKELNNTGLSAEDREAGERLSRGKGFVFREISDGQLRGYGLIRDIHGKPVLLVRADFPRNVMQRGKTTARMVSFATLSAITVVGVFLVIWFVTFQAESRRRQKKIEELVDKRTRELQESEERLRTLINATPDVICFKDAKGRWLEANRAQLELFQLEGIAFRGKTDAQLARVVHPAFRDSFLSCEETDQQAWEAGELTRSQEIVTTPDGGAKIFDVIKVPLFHPDGRRKGLFVFGRDVTQEKVLQDKLRKAEKMEAIGLMAGGVAHDLNNILAGLVGYPDLLLINLPDDSRMRPPLEAIRESGQRAAEVVSDLLTIARGVAASREPVNLNTMIVDYLDSPECRKIKASYPDIRCETHLDPDLLNIMCSPIHIKKCIMNLLSNAAEAIEGSGRVVVSTHNRYVDEPLAGNQYMERGEYVVLRISDTGPGIAGKDIDRIFEPFYTKKIMGKSGTGLGLTVVWNTVQDHGGGIRVDSSEKGTTFELYFPATRRELATDGESVDVESLRGRGEKILVVDDEAQQRDVASRMLTSLGYEVVCAESGEKAVACVKEEHFDLVVLDMIMAPGANGRRTYERILRICPGQKAVIVSGFSANGEVKEAQRLGARWFVRKPYTFVQIGEAVMQALRS